MKGCLGFVLIFLVVWFLFSLVAALIIFAGWNLIVAWLFVVPALTFWKAWIFGLILSFLGSLFRASITVSK